jgi:predicted membrane protein
MRGDERPASRHLFMGGILILVGVLFLLDTLNIANTGPIISTWWPLIIIAAGVNRLLVCNSTEGRIVAGGWIFLGSVFLLSRFGYVWFNVWRLIWPFMLIMIGTSLVLRSRHGRIIPSDDDSTISAMAFLGGIERRIHSQAFQGGELTAVMGGCHIDLREAAIQGEEAVLNVLVMMGGIELHVPQSWTVVSKVVPILGGFEDRTNPSKEGSKRLVIRGTVLMGGIDVKNF